MGKGRQIEYRHDLQYIGTNVPTYIGTKGIFGGTSNGVAVFCRSLNDRPPKCLNPKCRHENVGITTELEVGRAQAQIFHLFRKAQARAQLKRNLFSKFFKSVKPKPKACRPSPHRAPKNPARPTSTANLSYILAIA
jgi:hypothetical protein